jgi:hypothetical protein
MRSSRTFLFVAVIAASVFAREARAAAGVRLELEGGSGLMASQAVRNVTAPGANTSWSGLVSVSGAVGLGAWVGGINLDGGIGWFSGPLNGFAGLFTGSELVLDGTVLRGVVEFGMHAIDQAGADSSHSSDAPKVVLPYAGFRIGTETRLMQSHLLALGVSAFVRADLAHQQVTGNVTLTCDSFDDCYSPMVPTTFDVGGVTFGVGVSLTFGSER